MGRSTNKVMEAKNRKVRQYDMLAGKWAGLTETVDTVRSGEYIMPPKSHPDGTEMVKPYANLCYLLNREIEPEKPKLWVVKSGTQTRFFGKEWEWKLYKRNHPKARLAGVVEK